MGDEGRPEGSQSAPTTVFFSYSRGDQKAARVVLEALESAGFSVWWDGLLGGGERFAHTTAAALENARAVVVLWSKTAIDSHWVHDEATFGRDKRRLVPVSLDGSEPPLGFRQFQTIDISRGRRRGSLELQRVVDAVRALHDSPPTPVRARAPQVSRRAVLAGGVGVVAIGAGAAAWWMLSSRKPSASPNTVAVLPFANMSGVAGQNYFADGLSAEVRAALARNIVLRVVGQTSSDAFKSHTEDAKVIARKLGVAFLLDGNVRLADSRVRVSAELIDGQTGFSRWSQTFDRALDDIFAVQSEIADAVTSALTREVSAVGKVEGVGGTKSVAAFDSYLRGRAAFNLAESEETDREALARFDEATATDPKFAAAQAARSRSLAVIANQYAMGAERRAGYEDAIAAARRAVALAPKLADAQSALGYALFNGRLDIRAARAPFDQSYALGRGDPDVLGRFALYCARTGRFGEANVAISQAAELDPLNPRTFRTIGIVKYAARQYAEVATPAERALSLNPKMANVTAEVGYADLMLGKVDKANAAFLKERNALFRLPGLAIVAHRQGRAAEAKQAFDSLAAELGDNGLYQQAEILAQWGDRRGAIETLNRARAAGDSGLILARNDPLLDPIRKEPEFVRLLQGLGFD